MSGQRLPMKCSVEYISFSAHTDFEQTTHFIRTIHPPNVVSVGGREGGRGGVMWGRKRGVGCVGKGWFWGREREREGVYVSKWIMTFCCLPYPAPMLPPPPSGAGPRGDDGDVSPQVGAGEGVRDRRHPPQGVQPQEPGDCHLPLQGGEDGQGEGEEGGRRVKESGVEGERV